MDHINNGPYQILKKDPTAKIKPKTLKQLKALKDNTFIDIKQYYYLKLTDSPASRLNSHKKKKKNSQEFLYVLLFHVVTTHCTVLANIPKNEKDINKKMLKMKIVLQRILPRFSTPSEMFTLKMAR